VADPDQVARSMGPAATKELADVLTPVAHACAAAIPYPSPIGVPAPGTVT
jgi:hypothetical protein